MKCSFGDWKIKIKITMITETFGNITLIQGDCMEFMATLPDNAFDLAIVDPPYGIGLIKTKAGNWGIRKENRGDISPTTQWDFERPNSEYFKQLFRVSKNQIIWGGNYFIDFIQIATPCFIVWDKCNGSSFFADAELAWTSFKTATRIYKGSGMDIHKIHICQKPVVLYKWLLKNYAKDGDTILDTHGGSFSSAIAAHEGHFKFTGIELDADYYEAAKKRIINHQRQQVLF
jgi:site-specific DNA-methyltransferase (adenine-specific)